MIVLKPQTLLDRGLQDTRRRSTMKGIRHAHASLVLIGVPGTVDV
jgi:hypothetical protein